MTDLFKRLCNGTEQEQSRGKGISRVRRPKQEQETNQVEKDIMLFVRLVQKNIEKQFHI